MRTIDITTSMLVFAALTVTAGATMAGHEGAITVDVNDRVHIKPSASTTDLLQFELGVAMRF